MEKLRISPSLIKKYLEYRDKKVCGEWFLNEYIDKVDYKREYTEAQLMGIRFEYEVTGAIPRYWKEPPTQMLTPSTGKVSTKQKQVDFHVKLCKETFEAEKIQIIDHSWVMQYDRGTYDLKQINDIFALKDGVECFIDLKTSGFLYNKWEDYGWAKETLPKRRGLLIQAAVAKILARDCLHIEDIPFYYYIASTTPKSEDAELFEIVFDTKALLGYEDIVEDVGTSVFFESDLGFTPYPNMRECRKCQFQNICDHKQLTPKITKIYVQ